MEKILDASFNHSDPGQAKGDKLRKIKQKKKKFRWVISIKDSYCLK